MDVHFGACITSSDFFAPNPKNEFPVEAASVLFRVGNTHAINDKQMKNMVCLVTDANSGLGFGAAVGLARTGATVVMLCRNEQRGKAARIEVIRQSANPNVDLMRCDLSSMASVYRFAGHFRDHYRQLDVLVNTAGISYPQHELTAEGLERNLATNLAGPFLLTDLLTDLLKAGAPATILNVSGDAHFLGDMYFPDLHLHRQFTFSRAVTQTALGRVIWTLELNRRLQGTGVTANTFCPGRVNSGIFQYLPAWLRLPLNLYYRQFGQDPIQAMQPVLEFTLEHGLLGGIGGRYLKRGVPSSPSASSRAASSGRLLWEELEKMVTPKTSTATVFTTTGKLH